MLQVLFFRKGFASHYVLERVRLNAKPVKENSNWKNILWVFESLPLFCFVLCWDVGICNTTAHPCNRQAKRLTRGLCSCAPGKWRSLLHLDVVGRGLIHIFTECVGIFAIVEKCWNIDIFIMGDCCCVRNAFLSSRCYIFLWTNPTSHIHFLIRVL